ncbi:CHAT domain-containing protein [Anabaena sp. CCY 0017]|uniref:CHAT domain-containing protein n=1 Tax=Anabaena sp. CCY 0017 TaxID=3103866 RepID=UPI0039C68A0D
MKKYKNIKLFLIFLTLFTVAFSSSLSFLPFQFSIAIAQNNSKAEADRLRQQGEQQLAAGQYALGSNSLEQAMRMYQQIGNIDMVNQLRDRLILLYRLRGIFDKLQELVSENNQENVKEESQKPLDEHQLTPSIQQLIDQGFIRQNKQNFLGAEGYFQQALSQAKIIGREQDRIRTLEVFGGFYLYKGDFVKALAHLKLAEKLSTARYHAFKKSGNSSAYDYDDEIQRNLIPILLLISETYLQKQQPSQALPYLQKADAITPGIIFYIDGDIGGGYKNFKDSALYFSRVHYSLGNYKQALNYARRSIDIGEAMQIRYDKLVWEMANINNEGDFGNGQGRVLAGLALEKLGQLKEAEQELRQATQIFENIRKRSRFQGYTQHIFKLFNNQVRANALLQRVLLAQNKPAEALAASEWGRTRLLVEAASAPSDISLKERVEALVKIVYPREIMIQQIAGEIRRYFDSFPPGLDHQYNRQDISLADRINFDAEDVRRYVNSFPPGVDRVYNRQGEAILLSDIVNFDYEKEAEARIQSKTKMWLDAVTENPAALDQLATLASRTTSDIKPPDIKQLQQTARSHQTTLVQYSIISETTFFHPSSLPGYYDNLHWNTFPGEPEKLVIWVIKPTGEIISRQIDLKEKNINLKNLVTNTRQTMGLNRSIGVSLKPGAEVPENLNRSSSGVPAQEQLKQLHKLLIEPIADLLPTNPEAKVVFVPHQELFLVPFAALIDSQNNYLIEKHTILTAPSIQALEITRQKQQKQTQPGKIALVVGNPTMPTITLPNQPSPIQLRNLPGAEREGKEVAQFLNTKFLTGDKATKNEVLKQLPQARYIHLATHGLLEDYASFGIPGAIALAPSKIDNGLLNASEIQELNLTAELAVLSACDTGGGNITGDGVVGLSRSLIVAGVPSIVVSLWAIPDLETADLMVEFYRNFQEHKLDKAQALRQAMLTIKKDYPNPLYWAGFTLIGQSK